MAPGEGRRLELWTRIEPLELGGERYAAEPAEISVNLEVSRMAGHGYALRMRFTAALAGPCMRCLKDASSEVVVDAREVHTLKGIPDRAQAGRPGGGEELSSPYMKDETLGLAAWARDAFVLAAPVQVLCREECLGLCPECAADLNEVGPEHVHERGADPRWAKLGELKLE